MKRQWSVIISIIIILLIAVLAVLNVDPVSVNFGFTEVDIPLILLMVGMLLIGALVTVILSTAKSFKDNHAFKELKKENAHFKSAHEKEISSLEDKHQKELAELTAQKNKEIDQLYQRLNTQSPETPIQPNDKGTSI